MRAALPARVAAVPDAPAPGSAVTAGKSCGSHIQGDDGGIREITAFRSDADGIEHVLRRDPSGEAAILQNFLGSAGGSGSENGDKCAWISSGQGAATTVQFASGATFPVQSLWSNAFNTSTGGCVLSYP
jgi:hypothetical protein